MPIFYGLIESNPSKANFIDRGMIEELGTIFSKKYKKIYPFKAPNLPKRSIKENHFLTIC